VQDFLSAPILYSINIISQFSQRVMLGWSGVLLLKVRGSGQVQRSSAPMTALQNRAVSSDMNMLIAI